MPEAGRGAPNGAGEARTGRLRGRGATSALAALLVTIRRVSRRLADLVPPTPLGLALALLGWVLLRRYGLERLDFVLFALGALSLGLVAVALLAVAATAIALRLRSRGRTGAASIRCEAGLPWRTGFAMPALWLVPLVRCRWEWTEPQAVDVSASPEGDRMLEVIVPRERGMADEVERRILVEDVLGLARVGWRERQADTVRVLPSAGQLRQMPVLRAFAGGEDLPLPQGEPIGDRVDYRRYGPGDPVKTILWKTFARTRQVMVRTPERAIAETRRTMLFLVAAPHDEAAAGAARVAVEMGLLGKDGRFGADGQPASGTGDPEVACEYIAASAAARRRCGLDLEPFLREAERHGRVRTIVFVPPVPGPWIDRVAAAASGRAGLFHVVIGTDATVPARSSWLRRLLLAEKRPGGATRGDLDETIGRLLRAGLEPIVVERPTGRIYGMGHVRAMRAVAA